MHKYSMFLLATCAACIAGCPSPEDTIVAPSPDSGETGTPDTFADTLDAAEASCSAGDIETRACGACGKQSRTCASSGWEAWKPCQDEIATAECKIGDTRSTKCGNCGTQKDTCDPAKCSWVDGTCGGEGVCAPGDIEKTTASCTVAGTVRIRTCSDTCVFGPYSDCVAPKGWLTLPAAPTGMLGRYGHGAVWTGTEMIVWGGTYVDPTKGGGPTALGDGASYDFAGATWTKLPTAPSPINPGRSFPSVIYSGSQMIVWGGAQGTTLTPKGDGARYDPATKTWSAMTSTGAPSGRFVAGATWSTTTSEMIVWGGCTAVDTSLACSTYTNDGAAYDPVTDKWTALPAPPTGFVGRGGHSMEWSGAEVVIWGGTSGTADLNDGARYDPKTKIWTTIPSAPTSMEGRVSHASVWSGKEVLIYGGFATTTKTALDSGARYQPGGGWTAFTTPSTTVLPTAKRYVTHAWFGASKLWIWAGLDGTSGAIGSGASYDPVLDKWTAMDTTDAPTARGYGSTVWTGKEAIVFGGISISGGTFKLFADGGIFVP